MPQRADEPVDPLRAFSPEPLLAFSSELGRKPPESTESLAARVECLERALHRSARQIESLKSELATLVGTVDDIGKSAGRPMTWAPKPVSTTQTRFLTAIAGIVFGLALGVLGWTLWSRDSIDKIDTTVAAPEPAAEERPAESAAPPQPVAPLGVATPEPVAPLSVATPEPVAPLGVATPGPVAEPEPTSPAQQPVQNRVDYVGTLSIDAAPGGEVFVDREPAGQTPLLVQNLKAGSHLVWIQREGYRRFTRVVQVTADRVSRVWAELEPLPER